MRTTREPKSGIRSQIGRFTLSGRAAAAPVRDAAGKPASRPLLIPTLLESAGITRLREQQIDEPPTLYPMHFKGALASEAGSVPQAEWPGPPAQAGPGFRFASVHDYAQAYREGKTTPEEVARKVLEAIEASNSADPPLRAIIAVEREDVLEQASAATERIQEGRPLSVFDGVPVAVKDEVDMVPYPTTVGTCFLGKSPATRGFHGGGPHAGGRRAV